MFYSIFIGQNACHVRNKLYICKIKWNIKTNKITMKKVMLIALAAMMAGTAANANNKFDAPAAQLMATTEAAAMSRGGDAVENDEQVLVIVTFTDDSALDQIADLGAEISGVRADMALVYVPVSQLENLAAIDAVKTISKGYEAKPMMKIARHDAKIDEIHAGTGLEMPFDGSGVICGMMDTGLDVNHLNFLNDDGTSRITRMWVITGANAALRELTTQEEILAYSADNDTESHGTHVLGIMAGSYKGNADKVTFMGDRGWQTLKKNYPVPYYGVAPGAELAPCSGTLDGNNILIAAEKILNYAKERNKPAVMNLSLGHNFGPHDGTTAACRYLSEVGKEMLICISAGNEGGSPISYVKNFTSSDNEVKTFVSESSYAYGSADFWADDDTPFDITFVAVDKKTGEVVYSYKVTEEGTTVLAGSFYAGDSSYIRDVAFTENFGGAAAVLITRQVDPNNNRYNTYCSVQCPGEEADVVPGFILTGKNGKKVNMYANGNLYFTSNGIKGYIDGNDHESINDMATAQNVISVGAYNNADSWPTLEHGMVSYNYGNYTKGDIAPFSSYGTTPDGRYLPLLAGPGAIMISSYSHYYLSAHPSEKEYAVANIDDKRRSYTWAEMSGTSMSSPFVAGVMALWLQAYPGLTYNQAKKIIQQTSIRDEQTAKCGHRFGCGRINPLEGLKKVLELKASTDGITVESDVMVNQVSKGVFDIYVPGASNVTATLYSLTGATVATTAATGDNATLEASDVNAGVYVLDVQTPAGKHTQKVLVK